MKWKHEKCFANDSHVEKQLILVKYSFMFILLPALLISIFSGSIEANTVKYAIATYEDDVLATTTGTGYLQSNMYVPYTDNTRFVFWRWKVNIPKGATVTSAYISVKADNNGGNNSPSAVQLKLVDADSCSAFVDIGVYGRAVTGSSVTWVVPGDWSSTGGPNADGWYTSSNIATIVQEFIQRPGYKYKNYIGIRANHQYGPFKQGFQYTQDGSTSAVLEVNYTGGEAIVDVLMADPEVRIAQNVYLWLTNVSSVSKLVVYLDDSLIYTKTGSIGEVEVFTVNYSMLSAGRHKLDIQLLNSNNMLIGSNSRTWVTLHNGVPRVGIDENNALRISNSLFFPITSFMLDKSMFSNWPYVAPNDYGSTINSTHTEGYYNNSICGGIDHCIATTKDYINSAGAKGWFSIIPGRWDGFNANDPRNSDVSKLVQYVRALRGYSPWLLGYTWDDEPEGGSDTSYNPATTIRKWTESCHENDTDHPVFLNTVGYYFTNGGNQSNQTRIKEYTYLYNEDKFAGNRTAVADIYSIDYYPYEYGNNPAQPWLNLEDYLTAIDRAIGWNYNLIPVMTFIESQDIHDAGALGHTTSCGWTKSGPWTPDPTPIQLKNLIWASIIHGVKGISYFQYFCPIPDANIQVMKTAKEQITALTKVILGPESTISINKSVSMSGRVDTLVKEYGGKPYIFAANIKSQNESVRFDVPGLMTGESIYVYGEKRNISASNGYFQDDFGPLEVHIYVVRGSGAAPSTPTNIHIQ